MGLTLSEAQKYISDNKLVLSGVERERSDVYEAGVVLEQNPGSGVTVTSGDEISLKVSEGPGPTLRTYSVSYRLPDDVDDEGAPVEIIHSVQIGVEDVKGSRTVFDQQLSGGSSVLFTVEYYTKGTVTVYVDGEAVDAVNVS